jgi:HEAT repeat protein
LARELDRDKLLGDCSAVSECIDILGRAIPENELGAIYREIDAIRKILQSRFGDDAKRALLDKARYGHSGWRNLAGAILSEWGGWTEADIPALREALKAKPGGWIANCLGEIGSPEAIRVLVDDLVLAGFATQSGGALHGLGPQVLPYLLPALQTPGQEDLLPEDDYREGWRSAAKLIGEFRSQAVVVADDWIRIAKNRREPPMRRVAALRGLYAMGGYIENKAAALRPLQRDRNEKIADAAFQTLVSAHDPMTARKVAENCRPKADEWDAYSLEALECLRTLSEFGANARIAGDLVEPFLQSQSKKEQLYGIETLGLIGRQEAISKIENFLYSKDWRHVYAAVRALGQLGAKRSIPNIEAAVRDHWLWELKGHGEGAVTALLRNQPYIQTISSDRVWPGPLFGHYDNLLATTSCEIWSYRGGSLSFENTFHEQRSVISLSDGDLIGTDDGEFGGALVWRPKSGPEVTIVNHNTRFIFPITDGFISIHGFSHIVSNEGFAVHVRRSTDGRFSAEEIARFTGAIDHAKSIGEDLFAAESGGRVAIFSLGGIMESPWCDDMPASRVH